MKNTLVYVDGYNLYYGMMDLNYSVPEDSTKPALRKYLWLNLYSYVSSYLPKYYSINKLHYFTAPVLGDTKSAERQKDFWKALESISSVEIHLGKHAMTGNKYSEKQTDVKFALQMYKDALNENPDCMILLCADSDQIPTIQEIKGINPKIEFRAIFPPCRASDDLRNAISTCHKSDYKRLALHQFPDTVEYERDGKKITVDKPIEWK